MIKLQQKLILASGSKARKEMLENVGLEFGVMPAQIDERSIENNFTGTPQELALKLAQSKALETARNNPGALVIGADQVLECAGTILHKAEDKNAALHKLKMLRCTKHVLISAVSVAQDDKVLWSHADSAHLTMHDFSDAFLETYCEQASDALTRSVGAYELESHGAWLFEKVEGDFFTVLGMPLLPLLEFLRTI